MKTVYRLLGITILVLGGYYVWLIEINYNFQTITDSKVYKSGYIKNADKLESLLIDNKINTVIDLLDARTKDSLNPAQQGHIDIEQENIDKINKDNGLSIKHINIPSGQVPTKKTLTKFFKILDDKSNYPVLIHCYHGTGRAQIYSAIYRIEYENWKNKDARAKTRILVEGFGYKSSFADGKSKGDFLMKYTPRNAGKNSTLNTLKQ